MLLTMFFLSVYYDPRFLQAATCQKLEAELLEAQNSLRYVECHLLL